MTQTFTLQGFAAFALELAHGIPAANHNALEKAAVIVEKESKRVIGTYDYQWSQLAESTQDDRERHGFSRNEPLKRTGELSDSIQHKSNHEIAYVGSDLDRAVWQELGTRSIPPRSFLAQAAIHKEKEVVETIGRVIIHQLEGHALVHSLTSA